MNLTSIPAFQDNYIWVLSEDDGHCLIVDPGEAAQRVINDQRGKVETYKSHEEAMNCLIERKKSENIRYSTKYGVQCCNPDNYDLTINTTSITPEQVAQRIIEAVSHQ